MNILKVRYTVQSASYPNAVIREKMFDLSKFKTVREAFIAGMEATIGRTYIDMEIVEDA